MLLQVSKREFDTVLAALRCYQTGILDGRHVDHEAIDDLATDGFAQEKLTSKEVDTLCERINGGSLPEPDVDTLASWEGWVEDMLTMLSDPRDIEMGEKLRQFLQDLPVE